MLKAYKYRIYPNDEQVTLIRKHIGSCRFIYNQSLQQKIERYQKEKKTLSCYDLNNLLPETKKEYPWLSEVNSQSLQWANKNLDNAFTKFFREKKGFPKFKSKKHPLQSFQVPQHYLVDFDRGYIQLPKIGKIKTKIHRIFHGSLRVATISATLTGKFFISISFDDGKDIPEKALYDEHSTIGIDVGLTHYAIFSDGTKIENPRNLRSSLDTLKYHQKKMSRKIKGSYNYRKCKYRVARLHEKVVNQRRDFQHKLSTKIVRENQAVAVESLNISGMIKNHNLALSIADAAWGNFLNMVDYKCDWYGKSLIPIGQFDPSSKICHVCGYYNKDLTLDTREWDCSRCDTHHDRDHNAAINIKKFALQYQNLIGTGLGQPGEPADLGTVVPGMKREADVFRRR
jgi:putative transposase